MQSNPFQRKKRVLHVYGSTTIESESCPKCKRHAFIIDGAFSCCGFPANNQNWNRIKVETDTAGKRRRRPSRKQRIIILADQNYRCTYCEDEFDSYRTIDGQLRRVRLQWDHYIPHAYDGNNLKFVAACAECNHMKSSKVFSDFSQAKTYLSEKINEKKKTVTA